MSGPIARWRARRIYASPADFRRALSAGWEAFRTDLTERLAQYDADPETGRSPVGEEVAEWDVWARLRAPTWYIDGRRERDDGRADWAGVDPRLAALAGGVLAWMDERDIPLYVHAAWRSQAEQDEAYRAGRSKVTGRRAPHCHGAAIDIVHGRYAWDMTTAEWWAISRVVQMYADRLGLEVRWGGTFGESVPSASRIGWDPAHWEVRGWTPEPSDSRQILRPQKRTRQALGRVYADAIR